MIYILLIYIYIYIYIYIRQHFASVTAVGKYYCRLLFDSQAVILPAASGHARTRSAPRSAPLGVCTTCVSALLPPTSTMYAPHQQYVRG